MSWATERILRSRRISSNFGATCSKLHRAGGQQPLALQDHVLPAGVNHRRDLAVGHVEHRVLDLLVAAVLADRVDQPLGAGAGGVFGVVLGQIAELVGVGRRLGLQFLGLLQLLTAISRARTASPYSVSNSLTNSVVRDGEPLAGQLPQRQGGPNDVVGILLGRDVPLLLEHLQPLVDGNAEPLRHALDLGVHFGPRDADPCRWHSSTIKCLLTMLSSTSLP